MRTLLAEVRIPDGCDLVDQIAVEICRHGSSEGQPSAHASRIGVKRHVKELAEPGKLIDESDQAVGICPVDTCHETGVLPPCQSRVEPPGEPKRPTHPARPLDPARVRPDNSTNHLEQGRFSRAVPPDDPHIPILRQCKGHATKDMTGTLRRAVGLSDVLEPDQRSRPFPYVVVDEDTDCPGAKGANEHNEHKEQPTRIEALLRQCGRNVDCGVSALPARFRTGLLYRSHRSGIGMLGELEVHQQFLVFADDLGEGSTLISAVRNGLSLKRDLVANSAYLAVKRLQAWIAFVGVLLKTSAADK